MLGYMWKRLWKDGIGTIPAAQLHLPIGANQEHARNGAPTVPIPPSIAHQESGQVLQELQQRIAKAFGRSLHIRHLDSGSSNACEWEISALLGPVYDVQRFGIDFVASPRHADLLLVTGAVTRNLEEAVRRTYEAAPSPKWVVAVGDEACGSGIIGTTYAQYGCVDRILPVDVRVPGDPPSPIEILRGIVLAIRQLPRSQGG